MFDPNKPANGSPLASAEMRGQLNALNAMITAIQQGAVNIYVDENDPGGVDGDLWIRPSDGQLFRHESGAWSAKGSLMGPQGPTGGDGSQGPEGPQGSEGPPGPPGEVTEAQLDNAIAGTSGNTNSVATLNTPMVNAEAETLRQKLNAVILNGRR